MYDKRLTMDDYLSSRIIAEPFRLYDCCQESDGACAVLLSTAPRARDLRRKPVHVLAAGFGNDPGWGTGSGSHNMSAADYISSPAKTLSKRLYAMAGVDPSQIDTAQIYDHFAPFVLMQLEAYGFCSQGEGGRYVAEGNIRWPDGALPVNTAGGHLSEAYIHGLNLVVEGVRQMRGDATSQVSQARLCLIGCGGSGAILAN
jgi:acetyl-CoA acetyltransferase